MPPAPPTGISSVKSSDVDFATLRLPLDGAEVRKVAISPLLLLTAALNLNLLSFALSCTAGLCGVARELLRATASAKSPANYVTRLSDACA